MRDHVVRTWRVTLCAALAGLVSFVGGCAQSHSTMAAASTQVPDEDMILSEAAFNSSDPLGYILFVIEPQARAARLETSLIADAEAGNQPKQVIVSGEAPKPERAEAPLAAADR